MRNEKQKWLHKQYKELKNKANNLTHHFIPKTKRRISCNFEAKDVVNVTYYGTILKRARTELKELEKEIHIVKQLIKEVK